MMRMMISWLAVALFLLPGCNFFEKVGEAPVEDNALLIKSMARTAFYLAVNETHKDDGKEVVASEARKVLSVLENRIKPVLDRPDVTVDIALSDQLFGYIPAEYSLLIKNAVDVLRLYYKTPATGEIIGPEGLAYLRAFFEGAEEGLHLLIRFNET